jgi:outer membrane protein
MEGMMVCARIVMSLGLMLLIAQPSLAVGLEAAVGGWRQAPAGELAYEPLSEADLLDLEDDFNYEEEYRLMGRLKLDLPMPLPNLALMYTPMRFEEQGSTDFQFSFGGQTFRAKESFSSEVQLDHYDVGLYYGLPLLETATLDRLSLELGINVRIFDLYAEIEQPSRNLTETEDETVPLPMVYAALRLQPVEPLAFEVEARGVTYEDNTALSLIGRLKYVLYDPFFIVGGYRYESIDIDESDIEADIDLHGPFLELGLDFL